VTTIEIAPRADADTGVLFGLAKSAFGGLPGWSDGRVVTVLARDVVFVARDRGLLAGYVALFRDTDDAVVVDQLFVAPGHERRGIGRRLLECAEGYAIADRAGTLRIVVESTNAPARSFYRRWGFVPIEPELFELVLPQLSD
jgi:ribosomal protein S18 acetylase RimI-like enzyme